MDTKKYRFFYHFNKPLYQKTGEVSWTIHFRKDCIPVNKIECNVPTESHTQKEQPVGIIRGYASSIEIVDNKAIIK